MLRLLFDENFNQRILRGLRQRLPAADLLTVQQVGLAGMPDPDLLAWAAAEQRILATHDLQTMLGFAYERLKAGEYMAGVFAVPEDTPIGRVIDDLVLLIACSELSEWENRVLHLPL